jgi:AraC-like DNA-binding protein
MGKTYPTFDICNLVTNKLSNDLFNADRFQGYLLNNPPIKKVHKHSFYHLVYFTAGSGQHIIDFKGYPIAPGCIYFMRPGQVHKWEFESDVDGYVINFSATFFDQLSISSSTIDQFSFFNAFSSEQMLALGESTRSKVVIIFEEILKELEDNSDQTPMMIAANMLKLFVLSSREISSEGPFFSKSSYNSILLKQFLELIEENFKDLRLPKDYAALLYITSNHLNFICKDQINMSAGEVIRNRVLLEAKRMLVNFDLSVAAIALELNFFDTSYFIKFFKKYTQVTPETFRKQYYNKA